MALPVALQLYSVRDDMKADLVGTLQKVKEMGYSGVELAGMYDYTAEQIKAELDKVGLVAVSAHVPLQSMRDDMDKVIADYKTIGCKFMVVPYLPAEDRDTDEAFVKAVEDIRVACQKATDAGFIMLYHNHDFEFEMIGDKYRLDYLYENIPASLLQTQLDLCWVKVGGENPAEYLRKYADRAPLVHFKDFVGQKSANMYELIGIKSEAKKVESKFELRPVGYGCQDWYSNIKAVEDSIAKWIIVEQDQPTIEKTPLESAAMSRAYLKTLGY